VLRKEDFVKPKNNHQNEKFCVISAFKNIPGKSKLSFFSNSKAGPKKFFKNLKRERFRKIAVVKFNNK